MCLYTCTLFFLLINTLLTAFHLDVEFHCHTVTGQALSLAAVPGGLESGIQHCH